MAPPAVTARCPSCGQALRGSLAPAPATQWFPCPRCGAVVPVLLPRELPPLYSWEVVPSLYPRQSPPPRGRYRTAAFAALALLAAAVLAGACAGLLGYDGYVAAEPASYVVSGEVERALPSGTLVPIDGAEVVLYTDDNGSAEAEVTGPNGAFLFTGVPAGGIALNVTAPPGSGYAPLEVYTFASRAYATQTEGLLLTLAPGPEANGSTESLTPFPDLLTLLAYVGSGAVLAGAGAVAAALGGLAVRRSRGGVPGVIGAGASVALPVVLLSLSLDQAFPLATVLAAATGGVGAFALVLATLELSAQGEVSRPPASGPT